MTSSQPPATSDAGGVRVKICGITTPHDALLAQAAGADAIGLIFAPRSKRLVTPATAARIVAVLGPFIAKVGVFVDADPDHVRQLVAELRLDAVQLHGSESREYAAELAPRVKVIRAVSYAVAPDPDSLADYPADAFLLDAATPGSGTAFAWNEADAWHAHPRLILAGGLTPGNLARAIAALQPYAVDVASGVESAPGIKDAEAVRRFVATARSASH